ncbi:MAG: glutamate cyclase domain-containing protein [Dehalobacterium sp.]
MSNVSMKQIGEAVDRLVTVPMSNWTILKGLPMLELYETARRKVGGPLTLRAAELLTERVKPGDTVVFLTGFVINTFMRAETDGPIGAAGLARAVELGLGAVPVFLTEELIKEPIERTLAAAGLHVTPKDQLRTGGRGRKVLVQGFSLDHDEAKKEAIRFLDEFNPSAVIAVERPSWNRNQVHHSGGGYNISSITAKTDYVFEEARRRGILTIGIGDLGNEMGMGVIHEEICQLVPHGKECLCGCGAGIASNVSADVGIMCNISNWGAYGIEACLAAILEEIEVLHDGATERLMLRECAMGGAVDPVSGYLRPHVDGETEDINVYVVEMLRSIAKHRVQESIFTKDYRDVWQKAKKTE